MGGILFMERNDDIKMAELIKEHEKIVSEFTQELRAGLDEKKITIDGIEMLLLKTLEAVKRSFVVATEDIMSESGKKN